MVIFLETELILKIRKKEDKSEIEWTLLKYYHCLAIISEILAQESKMHYTSKEAIEKIRKTLYENL